MQNAPINSINPVYNSIPQQMSAQKPQEKRNAGNTVLSSAIDIGKTVAGGVAIGAVSGGVVSLLPFDNIELETASLYDTFLQTAKENETLPDNMKSAAGPFNLAKSFLNAQNEYKQIQIKEMLSSAQLDLAKAFDDGSIKSTILELSEKFKTAGVDLKGVLPDDTLDSNALEALKTDWLIKITEAINKNTVINVGEDVKNTAFENIMNTKNAFVEGIQKFIKEAPKGDELVSAAKVQAKIASCINLMGKAISFAVAIALITKMFDIFSAPKGDRESRAKAPAPNLKVQVQAPSQAPFQTNRNVWNIFAQSNTQGLNAPGSSFNKFMTLG